MNSLCVERLSFERDDLPILENINFRLDSGDIAQFAGHNGCGKTTLMRVVAGLILPSEGLVSWNGQSVQSYAFKTSLLYLGHQVGVKLTMTPLENLRWYFGLHGSKLPAENSEVRDQASHDYSGLTISSEALMYALEQVGLKAYADVPGYQLSAGQQRRVALARLYLSKAPLWLLDEPFTAIDKHGVRALEQLIEKHAERGGLTIITTHQSWNSDKIKIIDLEQFKPEWSDEHD